jgi:hypothetical protein
LCQGGPRDGRSKPCVIFSTLFCNDNSDSIAIIAIKTKPQSLVVIPFYQGFSVRFGSGRSIIRKSAVEYNVYGTLYYGMSMCRYNGIIIIL